MEKPVVEIHQGKLLGTISQDLDGNNFYSFRGIPYATPPIGKLRFRAPLPPEPWQGTFHATKNGDACYSKALFKKEMIGSENCLNLNVYTPKLPSDGKTACPVMVWIHGGGFLTGSNESDIYGPEFLMTENVVLVTINYRFGLLGFLSLDDPSAQIPGNAGFKDMVMALKWVNSNIIFFNGNPNNVTIFGESAGGVSVHLLTLSPMAKGLFHKAIAQSGCALDTWAQAKKADDEIRISFNCEGKSDVELAEHLRNLPVEKILENQARMKYVIDPATKNHYGYVLERKNQADVPFLTEEAIDIILSRKFSDIPIIFGYNNLDGLVVNTYTERRYVRMMEEFQSNLPWHFGYKFDSEESKEAAKKIRDFYFPGEVPNQKNRDQFYKMVTDHTFMYGTYLSAKLHTIYSNCPVYFYRMSLTTSLKFLQALMKSDQEKGAAHADDVAYLFKTVFTPPISPNSVEYKFIKMFVGLWTNFARFGNPTPEGSSVIWHATDKRMGFMSIDRNLRFFDTFDDEKSVEFWKKIHDESPTRKCFVKLNSKM